MGALTTAFRGAVSKLKDYRMKLESEPDVGYSTGFLGFDFKNGAIIHVRSESRNFNYPSIGLVDGSMTMIIGRSGCGKSTWAVQAAANIVRPYENSCVFEDNVEGGVTTTRRENLTKFFGDQLKDKFISRNTGITAENFYERVKMIHDIKIQNREEYEYDTKLYDQSGDRIYKLVPTVVLLDSIAMLMPEKLTEEDELSGNMSAAGAAKVNTGVFKRIIPMLKAANIILLIINHIMVDININPMQRTKAQVSYLKQGESLPGGRAITYLANNIIRFDDNSKLKEEEAFGIDGSLVDVSFVKSRTNKAGKSVTLVFDQNSGFDEELSLFLLLKQNDRISGAGAYLFITGHDEYKFAQKAFKRKLREIPEFRQIFIEEVYSLLNESLIGDAIDEENSASNVSSITDAVMSRIYNQQAA